MNPLKYLHCLARRHHTWTAWTPWERRADGSSWSMRSCTRCPRRQYRSDRYASTAIITNDKEDQ